MSARPNPALRPSSPDGAGSGDRGAGVVTLLEAQLPGASHKAAVRTAGMHGAARGTARALTTGLRAQENR
jgi:hypothetical protein